MLTVTALTNAEYVLSSVALGIDEYYTGVGEAPGVWAGSWAKTLGLVGMVEADALRALIEGNDPTSQVRLLTGRERTVKAFDLTFSAPKSVSLLWALLTGPESIALEWLEAPRAAPLAAGLERDEVRPERSASGGQVIGSMATARRRCSGGRSVSPVNTIR